MHMHNPISNIQAEFENNRPSKYQITTKKKSTDDRRTDRQTNGKTDGRTEVTYDNNRSIFRRKKKLPKRNNVESIQNNITSLVYIDLATFHLCDCDCDCDCDWSQVHKKLLHLHLTINILLIHINESNVFLFFVYLWLHIEGYITGNRKGSHFSKKKYTKTRLIQYLLFL